MKLVSIVAGQSLRDESLSIAKSRAGYVQIENVPAGVCRESVQHVDITQPMYSRPFRECSWPA